MTPKGNLYRPVWRVNFITLHWYGGDFRTAAAVREPKSYLQAVWQRYRKPIWLTEYALPSTSTDGTVGLYRSGARPTPQAGPSPPSAADPSGGETG